MSDKYLILLMTIAIFSNYHKKKYNAIKEEFDRLQLIGEHAMNLNVNTYLILFDTYYQSDSNDTKYRQDSITRNSNIKKLC